MESTAVTIAVILSFIAGEKFGMLNVGTLIFTVSVGFMIQTYLGFFEKVGLYKSKGNIKK